MARQGFSPQLVQGGIDGTQDFRAILGVCFDRDQAISPTLLRIGKLDQLLSDQLYVTLTTQ